MKKRSHKGRKFGTAVFVLGLLLCLGAVGLTAFNLWDSKRAAQASETISQQLIEKIEDRAKGNSSTVESVEIQQTSVVAEADGVNESTEQVPTVEVNGYGYVGILEIPGLELSLPVMDTWDEERLKISPCLYAGSYYTDDMVICAHNYIGHFSAIRWISLGESVNFYAVDETAYYYKVVAVETLEATAIDEMIHKDEDGTSDWDLTLFTCNTGGQTRCVVRCIRTADA